MDILLEKNYVSEDTNVRDLFLDTKRNLYLRKGSTGIGGTTTILESNDATRIVVSPTTGMISSKSHKIKNKNCFFIWGNSQHTWDDFFNAPKPAVVNCTPDQIVNLEKNGKLNLIDKYTIFIDEIDQYVSDSDFRDSVGDFLKFVFQWKGNIIVSSATDNLLFGKRLELHPDFKYETYNIIRNKSVRHIEYKPMTEKLTLDIIEEAIFMADSNGRKLLIATNDTSLHKKLSKSNYKVLNLVGDNMNTKLTPYKYKDKDDEDPNLYDIIMISSKYYVGYDLNDVEVDVLIDTNPHLKHTLIGVNNIVQIIGRPRKGVGRIILCVNLNEPDDASTKFISTICKDDIEKSINEVNKDNWIIEHSNIINNWKHYQLRHRDILLDELKRYNIILTKWKDNRTIKNNMIIDKHIWSDKIKQLLITDINELKLDLYRIIKYLKYKDDGIFSADLAILFYSAIMIKTHNINISINKKDKPSRKYDELNKKLNDETWSLLYLYYKCKSKSNKDMFNKEVNDYIKIRSLPSTEMLEAYEDSISCYLDCKKLLQSKKILIDKKEDEKLEKRCIDYFKFNKKEDIKTEKQLLNLIGNACLYLVDYNEYEKEFWQFPMKRNRQYNPLTQLPRKLRQTIPVELVEVDINAANPTFIDIILDSNIGHEVYDKISQIYQCDRDKAKVLYNTYLNNDKGRIEDVFKFFQTIGYNNKQSQKLTRMVLERKGSIYDRMTEIERLVIETYQSKLKFASNMKYNKLRDNMIVPSYRLHDALIFKKKYLYEMALLPTEIKIDNKYVKLTFKSFYDGTDIGYGTH